MSKDLGTLSKIRLSTICRGPEVSISIIYIYNLACKRLFYFKGIVSRDFEALFIILLYTEFLTFATVTEHNRFFYFIFVLIFLKFRVVKT
jgi:hypothetical protein